MSKYQTEVTLKKQESSPIRPTQIILHSLGNGYSWEGGVGWLLDPNNPLEAHIAIRKDGLRRKLVPYNMRADANYKANKRPDGTGAISVETDSSIYAEEPWTPDQVASIIELGIELCKEYNIPARLCRNASDPGIGYHIMWGSPGAWTPAAKVCPGPARIKQVAGIVGAIAAGLSGGAVPTPKPPTGPIVPDRPEPNVPTKPMIGKTKPPFPMETRFYFGRKDIPNTDHAIDGSTAGKNGWVRLIQNYLNQAFDAKLKVDGLFGPATEKAVKTFQKRFLHPGLDDGKVGRATWNRMGLRV